VNPQGVGIVTSADVPQILTQEPGAAAPATVTGENGAVVPQSSLTALFNSSGDYVGSYGIDPSTGAFSAWNAQGQETSFQAFAAEHNLANGATPVAYDGGNAVLYNSSGQLIGLDVAGYVVTTPVSAQSGSPTIGLTTVYDVTGSDDLGSFGYSESAKDFQLNGSSADGTLESEYGFTAAQISYVEQSVQANGGWNLSDSTVSAVYNDLIANELGQNSVAFGNGDSAVYNAQGSYVGTAADVSGIFAIFDQNGSADSTPVLTDDAVSVSEQEAVAQAVSCSTVTTSSDTANLRQISQALSAYLLAQGAGASLTNAVDVYDSGTYLGNVGIDSATGQFAIEESTGIVLDTNASLVSPYGLTSAALANAQQLWTTAASSPLSSTQTSELSSAVSDLGKLLSALDADPFGNLTPAQVAAYTPQQLSEYSASQIEGLSAAQINPLDKAQVQALNAYGLSASALGGLTSNTIQALSNAQIAALGEQQVQALGTSAKYLTASQVGSLIASGASGLSTFALAAFTTAQLQALSASAGVAGLSSAQLGALSAAQQTAFAATLNVGVLSSAEVAELTTSVVQALTNAQVASFQASQASGLQSVFSELSASQIGALQPAVVAAFTPEFIEGLTTPQLQATTASQLSALSAYNVSWLTASQINVLSASQIKALNLSSTIWQFSGLSASAIQSLSGGQIASLLPLAIQQLGTSVQYLTAGQIPSLNVAALWNQQVAALTLTQIAALTASQISQLNTQQIWSLNTAQFSAFSTAQVQSFTGTQLSAAGPELQEVLTPGLISELAPTQVASLSSQQLQALDTAQIAALTAPQIQALANSQLAEFTNTQLASLSATQIQALTAAQIQGLGASTLQALTSQQISALTANQLGAFSATQLADLSVGQLGGLTDTQLEELTPAQTDDFSVDQYSVISTDAAEAEETLAWIPVGGSASSGPLSGDPPPAGLPDGVYIGFINQGQNGAGMAHSFFEVVQDGVTYVYGYGPGANDQFVEMNGQYNSSAWNAATIFQVQPPQGWTVEAWTTLGINAGNQLDNYLADNSLPYAPTINDCYTGAAAIAASMGVPTDDFAWAAGVNTQENQISPLSQALSAIAATTTNQSDANWLAQNAIGVSNTETAGLTQMEQEPDGSWQLPEITVVTSNNPSPTLQDALDAINQYDSDVDQEETTVAGIYQNYISGLVSPDQTFNNAYAQIAGDSIAGAELGDPGDLPINWFDIPDPGPGFTDSPLPLPAPQPTDPFELTLATVLSALNASA
jgi:hypothetical protein